MKSLGSAWKIGQVWQKTRGKVDRERRKITCDVMLYNGYIYILYVVAS